MKNKDYKSINENSLYNNNGNEPCSKSSSSTNSRAGFRYRDAFHLILDNQGKLLKNDSDLRRSIEQMKRALAAVIAHINLNTECPADKIIVDNRVLSVMKSAMVSAAVERLLNGDGKTSCVLREVFESYRDRPGAAYDSYDSFARQVFRFWKNC